MEKIKDPALAAGTLVTHACVKISSAISDIDELTVMPEFKGKMVNDMLKFQEWFLGYTDKVVSAMHRNSPDTYIQVMKLVVLHDSNFKLNDPFEHRMLLICAKLVSGKNDLTSIVDCPDYMKDFIKNFIDRVDSILDKSYIKKTGFLNNDINNDRGFHRVVDRYDKLFKLPVV
jgi:hypothetical protein